MSDPILPLAPIAEGTTQIDIEANDNFLRLEALSRPCLGIADDAAGGDTQGDVWIVGDTPTGAFATFDEDDIAIFDGIGWHAWVPVEGLRLVVNDVRKMFDGSGGWVDDPAAGGGGSGDVTGPGSSTDGHVALFNGTSGKLLKDGGVPAVDRSTVTALATSGTVNIDASLGDYFTLALSGNVTSITFSNLPGSGHGASLMIRITQDSTARTVAWPASFKWAGGAAGSVSTGSGAVDVLAITTFDNGTTWNATLAKAFA